MSLSKSYKILIHQFRYFSQRYSIFSWYDEGIYLTDDAWFGVTPEPVAKSVSQFFGALPRFSCSHSQVAQDIRSHWPDKDTVIDVFAGAGGNAIAFALAGHWSRIIAIERDASTLACAQHNASVNGIDPGTITWVHGDSFEYMELLRHRPEQLHPDLRVDKSSTALFASPPWGGPGYRTDQVFDLQTMEPYNLAQLQGAYEYLDHALYLPRTSDIRHLAKLAPEDQKIEVVQYCMEGASKAMVAYVQRNPVNLPG